jgi:hypothetical protein
MWGALTSDSGLEVETEGVLSSSRGSTEIIFEEEEQVQEQRGEDTHEGEILEVRSPSPSQFIALRNEKSGSNSDSVSAPTEGEICEEILPEERSEQEHCRTCKICWGCIPLFMCLIGASLVLVEVFKPTEEEEILPILPSAGWKPTEKFQNSITFYQRRATPMASPWLAQKE